MTHYETKETGWVEGVERMVEDALNNLSNLHTALGLRAIKTGRPETYQLQSRYDLDYFDLKYRFEDLARAPSPELAAEVIPTTVIGLAIGMLEKLKPWWEELGLDPDSPVIKIIAVTLPKPPTSDVKYNNYLALFVEGFERGLGQDIGEESIALAKRHLRSSVALVVFYPIYLAGMVKGIYDKAAEGGAELKRFVNDPQAFLSETIAAITALLSLPADEIVLKLGESTGQDLRDTIVHLAGQNNAYIYIFELGKVMGPLVAGLVIEIVLGKGVSWLAGKALTGLREVLEKLPWPDSLRVKYRERRIPSEKELETPETKVEAAPSTATVPSSPIGDVPEAEPVPKDVVPEGAPEAPPAPKDVVPESTPEPVPKDVVPEPTPEPVPEQVPELQPGPKPDIASMTPDEIILRVKDKSFADAKADLEAAGYTVYETSSGTQVIAVATDGAKKKGLKKLHVDADGIVREGPRRPVSNRISSPGLLRRRLVKAIEAANPGFVEAHQAHHLIPDEVARKSDLVKRADELGIFEIDTVSNGLLLPTKSTALKAYKHPNYGDLSNLPMHRTSHAQFSEKALKEADSLWKKLTVDGTLDPAQIPAAKIEEAIKELREELIDYIQSTGAQIPAGPRAGELAESGGTETDDAIV